MFYKTVAQNEPAGWAVDASHMSPACLGSFGRESVDRLAARKATVRANTDLFIALTPEAKHALMVEGVAERRIRLQPYGVDPARFVGELRSATVRTRWGAGDDDVVLLFLGRLVQEKGLVHLLRAVAEVDDEHLVPVVVGQGPEGKRLDRVVSALGLKRFVREP